MNIKDDRNADPARMRVCVCVQALVSLFLMVSDFADVLG